MIIFTFLMYRIMYVLCTGSERLCSKIKFSSLDVELDNNGILSFIIYHHQLEFMIKRFDFV